jgi:hypothetical protein
MAYHGEHHLQLMQKSTEPVINIAYLNEFPTSGVSSVVQSG